MVDLDIEEFEKTTRERVQAVAEEIDDAEREMKGAKKVASPKRDRSKVVRMKERGEATLRKPAREPVNEEPLTRKTTVKFTNQRFERLRRAVHLQAINNRKPDTIQGILNEAFDAWWKESGYE